MLYFFCCCNLQNHGSSLNTPLMIDNKSLSECDTCTKFITPALEKAGCGIQLQVLEEVSFTGVKNIF